MFPRPETPAAVMGYHLRCEGLPFDTVTRLSDTCQVAVDSGSVAQFLRSYVSRYPLYVSGIHPVQALLRAVTMTDGIDMHETFQRQATDILFYIIKAVKDCGDVTLADLGLYGETRLSDGILNQVFSGSNIPGFHDAGSVDPLASIGGDDSSTGSDNMRFNNAIDLLSDLEHHRIFETSRGYLGLTTKEIKPGDVVYILKGSDRAAVLREVDDNLYSFMNYAFVVGLEDSKAMEFVHKRRRTIRALYIQ